jgi:hypothetical protein
VSTRRTRRRDTWTVVKDVAVTVIGLALIIREGWFVPPSDFNLALLLFGGLLAQIPGAQQLWALRTGSPQSWQESEDSPPSRSSSLSGRGADDDH